VIRRLNVLSNRHPLLSILIGFAAVVAIILAIVPADPPSVDAAANHSTT
jgi:hypothetical protein